MVMKRSAFTVGLICMSLGVATVGSATASSVAISPIKYAGSAPASVTLPGLFRRPPGDAHMVMTHVARYPGNITLRIDAVHVDPGATSGAWSRSFGVDLQISQGRHVLLGGAANTLNNQGRPEFDIQCMPTAGGMSSVTLQSAPTAVSYSGSYFLVKVPLADLANCGFTAGPVQIKPDTYLMATRWVAGQPQYGQWMSTETGLTITY